MGESANVVDYIHRYGGRCRECADHFGICPMSGLPCAEPERTRAIQHVLSAIEYGNRHGFISTESVKAGYGGQNGENISD